MPKNKPTPKRRRRYKCPACRRELSKKYLRSLSPLEWEKLQTAYWMEAWNRERNKCSTCPRNKDARAS